MAQRQNQLALAPAKKRKKSNKKSNKKIKFLAKILALVFQKVSFILRKNNYLIVDLYGENTIA